jgi:hypothetical protein
MKKLAWAGFTFKILQLKHHLKVLRRYLLIKQYLCPHTLLK